MPFAGELYVQSLFVLCFPIFIIYLRVGWDQQLLLVPYNKHFRAMRKLAQGLTGTKAAAALYSSVQETEAKYLVSRIHERPTELVKHLQTFVYSLTIHSLNS